MKMSHDQYFQRIFADAERFAGFLQGYLHPAESSCLQLNSLVQLPETLVDPSLRKSLTDILWSCPMMDQPEQQAHLCILMEHKAQRNSFPHLQINRYMNGIWSRQHSAHGEIHPILPILFHQGRYPIKIKPMRNQFSPLPSWIEPYTPLFDLRLCDLSQMDYAEIPQRFAQPDLCMGITAMKWSLDRPSSQPLHHAFAQLKEEDELQEFNSLINYIGGRRMPGNPALPLLTPQEILTMASKRPKKEKAMMMSLFDVLRAEGLERGLAEGKAEGLEEGLRLAKLEDARKMRQEGLTPNLISRITGLDPQMIASL